MQAKEGLGFGGGRKDLVSVNGMERDTQNLYLQADSAEEFMVLRVSEVDLVDQAHQLGVLLARGAATLVVITRARGDSGGFRTGAVRESAQLRGVHTDATLIILGPGRLSDVSTRMTIHPGP